MPRRRAGAPLTLIALVGLTGALTGCGDDDEATPSAPPSTVEEGPIAAVAVAAGDCLNGIVIGAAERAEVRSAEVVSCDRPHGLEVFATFTLDPEALDLEDGGDYPGRPRIVDAADIGCSERMESMLGDAEAFGLIALWPSQASWTTGDRSVACAVFARDGSPFQSRQL